ncbi:MAG: DUF4298 domain-containing protein [Oscillospiraceae bacterium]|jgi:hypothetical protein|nr:DUF4298 domain-containing protein [Oscillospiraceae bacterium]MBR5065774.1 DUF4298 domain-containing protein [Oscillospiraceae bacterium]
MKRTDRVSSMEKIMDEMQTGVSELRTALDRFSDGQKRYGRLIDYYGSTQWLKDYEADEAGKLPADLKRGVLSEDGMYDLILEYKELLIDLLATAENGLKNV